MKFKNIDSYNSLQELYQLEVIGATDFYKNIIKEVYLDVQTKSKTKIDLDKFFLDKLYMGLDNKLIPTIDIGAMLHSKIRWNETQKYKKGDIDDFRHAIAALPFYEYFFTERGLSNMIKEIKYDKKYNCTIANNNKDIITKLMMI